jgi:hypothetical protein
VLRLRFNRRYPPTWLGLKFQPKSSKNSHLSRPISVNSTNTRGCFDLYLLWVVIGITLALSSEPIGQPTR